MNFASLSEIQAELLKGEMVLVYDEHRECEGDFFFLAEYSTPEKMNFLLTYGKGLPTIPCADSVLTKMDLKPMVDENENPHSTLYYQSFDAKEGVTTGVSAFDLSHSALVLVDPKTSRKDITVPGHTFPLGSQHFTGRFGHTEAGVLLAESVGATPAMVICEILNEIGAKATFDELQEMAKRFKMPITTLDKLKDELLG